MTDIEMTDIDNPGKREVSDGGGTDSCGTNDDEKIVVEKPVWVSIIMGSVSDMPIMTEAVNIMIYFDIPYEVKIVSAHRTPERMFEHARSAQSRGIQLIIAGAGGAAHLPGMTASLTNLPVIGVPIKTSTMSGLDSLYSIVQMPRGIPVATMAINGAKNAGILAARILALQHSELNDALTAYTQDTEKDILKYADNPPYKL